MNDMIQIMARVEIEDLAHFISGFATRGAAMRRLHGSKGARLFRVSDVDKEVVILFDWESRESFQRFLNDPMMEETVKSSGITAYPEFTCLENIATFPS